VKLEHVAINVAEPRGLAQWFVEHLGMRLVSAQDEVPYAHFLADEDGSMLELYNNPAAPLPNYADVHPLNLHFAFATPNIEEARARLVAAGATPIGEISTNAVGDKLTFLRAPGQVPIQLVQRRTPLR
jgi:glyoxylase I family protein